MFRISKFHKMLIFRGNEQRSIDQLRFNETIYTVWSRDTIKRLFF